MAIPILNQRLGEAYLDSKNIKNHYRFYPERGLIYMEDTTTGFVETMSIRTFVERYKSLNDMLGNSKKDVQDTRFAADVERLRRFIDQANSVARLAQEQGDPSKRETIQDRLRRLPVPLHVNRDERSMAPAATKLRRRISPRRAEFAGSF